MTLKHTIFLYVVTENDKIILQNLDVRNFLLKSNLLVVPEGHKVKLSRQSRLSQPMGERFRLLLTSYE